MRRQGGSLRLLPLPGHLHEDAHRSAFRLAKGLRSLYRKILDEKIRHAGLQIIEQRLKSGLADFKTLGQADKSFRRPWTLQIDLGRQHIATSLLDRGFDSFLQTRAGNRDGLANKKWRPIVRRIPLALELRRSLRLAIQAVKNCAVLVKRRVRVEEARDHVDGDPGETDQDRYVNQQRQPSSANRSHRRQ